MLPTSLVTASLLFGAPAVSALSLDDVLQHMKKPQLNVCVVDLLDPSASPPPPATEGFPYLIQSKERCHDALLELFEQFPKGGRVKGRHVAGALDILSCHSTLDLSRFLPYVEKLALAGHDGSGLSEETYLNSIRLLAKIGKGEHIEKLLPLVLKDDRPVFRESLAAIVKLGDERHRDLVAGLLTLERFNQDTVFAEVAKTDIEDAVKALDAKPAPGRKK